MSEKDKNNDEQRFSGDEKNEGFLGTPKNYFESFSARLFAKIKANDELKDYPLLSSMAKQNPFVVPDGYFEAKEELMEYPVLRLMKENAFSLPENYFELLPAAVADKIELEKELQSYETLGSLEKENSFAVPAEYFEGLHADVNEIVRPAKVVPLYSRALKEYKFVAAAAVALLIVLSVVLLNHREVVTPVVNDCNTFACLSKKEIISSGVIQSVSEESIIEMIDVNALSDSLSVKNKNGKTEKVDVDEVSDNIDVNTLTEEL